MFENKKLGLLEHDVPDRKLIQIRWKADLDTLAIPDHCDNMAGVQPGLDRNDQIGDCGPTSIDNHNRIVTYFEGKQVSASQEAVNSLYAAASKPPFNPLTGENDNGVKNPDLMAATEHVGLDGKKILAYGRLEDTSDASVQAAIYCFKAVIWAVTLDKAQQAQSEGANPIWNYAAGSPIWGGHDIVAGAYDKTAGTIDVFSWAQRIKTSVPFRQHQLSEVWIPLWPEFFTNPLFGQLVDIKHLADQFAALTGGTITQYFPGLVKPLPKPLGPVVPPVPVPQPVAGGVNLLVSNQEVISHLESAAAKAGLTDAEWLEKNLKSYFKIKD